MVVVVVVVVSLMMAVVWVGEGGWVGGRVGGWSQGGPRSSTVMPVRSGDLHRVRSQVHLVEIRWLRSL